MSDMMAPPPPDKSGTPQRKTQLSIPPDLQRKSVAGAVVGVIVLIAGYVLAGITSSGNALCNSTLGELGSALDSNVAHDCGMYTTVNSLGSALIGLGWFAVVVSGIMLAIILGHKYVRTGL